MGSCLLAGTYPESMQLALEAGKGKARRRWGKPAAGLRGAGYQRVEATTTGLLARCMADTCGTEMLRTATSSASATQASRLSAAAPVSSLQTRTAASCNLLYRPAAPSGVATSEALYFTFSVRVWPSSRSARDGRAMTVVESSAAASSAIPDLMFMGDTSSKFGS